MKIKLSLLAVVLGILIVGVSCTGKAKTSESKSDSTRVADSLKAVVDTTHVAKDSVSAK